MSFYLTTQSQFGYTCRETTVGLLAWAVYWTYPVIVILFALRVACFR